MRCVQDQAQAVGLDHQRLALGTQAIPLWTRRVGGRIAEVVVLDVGDPQHSQAELVVELQQTRIAGEWRSIFHADERNALARGGDAFGVGGGRDQLEIGRIGGDHFANLHHSGQAVVASDAIAGFIARPLLGVDHPESTVQATFFHPRQIHL